MKKLNIFLCLLFISMQSCNYKSGELSRTRTYVDGLRQGEEKEYYDSGELQYTSNYVDDLKQGEETHFSQLGEITYKQNYIKGVEVKNLDVFYYDSGQVRNSQKIINKSILAAKKYQKILL